MTADRDLCKVRAVILIMDTVRFPHEHGSWPILRGDAQVIQLTLVRSDAIERKWNVPSETGNPARRQRAQNGKEEGIKVSREKAQKTYFRRLLREGRLGW